MPRLRLLLHRVIVATAIVLSFGLSLGQGRAEERGDLQQKLREELDQVRKEHQVPGLWAGKFYADGRSLVEACGIRRWGEETPVDPLDAVHLGSCCKAMTAAMIAQLCSEEKLSLETPLHEIFPEVERLAETAWGKITIVQLMQHTSGAPANAHWPKLHARHPDDPVAARAAMLRWMADLTPPEDPAYRYSNVGYALLGHIAETLEEEPWETLVVRRIFKPLGITTGGLGPVGRSGNSPEPADENKDDTPAVTVDRPWGHTSGLAAAIGQLLEGREPLGYQPVEIDNPPPINPAGRVHMNLADWAKFAILFASDSGHEKLGIKPEIWSKYLAPSGEGNYAGGWALIERDWADGPVLTHSGSNTTWYCVAYVAPKKGYCLLAATNAVGLPGPKCCDRAVTVVNQLGF